mgnify:CR=1 FL=1|jgi:hypothetical protein
MNDVEWDAQLVRAWLSEAADTLSRLPSGVARNKVTSWPLVISQSNLEWRPNPPHPGAIDRMDYVLQWVRVCRDDERKILWARANGFSWRRIAQVDGRSHSQMRILEVRAVDRILKFLHSGDLGKPIPVPRGHHRAPVLNQAERRYQKQG